MKNTYKFLLVVFFAVMLVFFIYHRNSGIKNFSYQKNFLFLFDKKNQKRNQYYLIAHAGGEIDGRTYTNSLEALTLSISKGVKLIELDFLITKDNHLVAAHHWEDFKKITNYQKNSDSSPLSLKEFLQSKILGQYTPMSIYDVNRIFEENKDLFLLTDKIQDFELLMKSISFDKKRLVVEVFGKQRLRQAIKSGVLNPLYSTSIKEIKFITQYNLKLIVVPFLDIVMNQDKYYDLYRKGVVIFAHSPNMRSNKSFKNQSIVSAIYSDLK